MEKPLPRTHDPDTRVIPLSSFLAFPGCAQCVARPCMELRFGRAYAGKVMFVAARTVPLAGCPLIVAEAEDASMLLCSMSNQELIFQSEKAVDELSPADAVKYGAQELARNYHDRARREMFLRALLANGLAVMARIPPDYARDRRLRQWFGHVEQAA
jgi:hypothetical protein